MLKPAVRRSLVFVLMMSAGLAVVFMVEDENPTPVHQPAYGKVEPGAEGAVTIRDLEGESETQVKLTEMVISTTSTVELPDGSFQERQKYRIHWLSATPNEAGDFVVERPDVTLLDLETGADRGSIRAEQGVIELPGGGPILGVFEMRNFDLRNFDLIGDVHGEFVMEEGPPATFDSSELQVKGENLFAPGPVTLTQDEMTMHGTDMRWNDTTRVLRFERVSRIEFDGEPAAVLESSGGLEWFVGEGENSRGYGTLFGPITGQAANGSRLEGDRLELSDLELSDDAFSMTLVGGARYDFVQDGALWTMTGDSITVHRLETGDFELTRAEGDVRLASEDADPPGWFETDRLDGMGQSLVALGPVRGRYGDFSVTAVGMRWNEPAGQLDLLADVVIDSLAADPGTGLPGAHVTSPGGVFLTTIASGMRARFGGPVQGSMPGLGTFECAELTYDEASGEVVLDGSAKLVHTLSDQTGELTSERVVITVDEHGTPYLVSAPGSFEMLGDDLEVSGHGLTLDNIRGLFKINHTAYIARTLDDGKTEWIRAPRGVTWWRPEDSSLDARAGHGEFRGRISGETEDGVLFAANSLEMDGGRNSLALDGSAVITHPVHGQIESERLDLVSTPAGVRIRSPVLVTWTGDQISGHGTGLEFDQERGHLSLDHDVLIRLEQEDGITREISCDGRFTWEAPPGAVDPLEQGVGEFRENVIGRDSDGSRFSADRLLVNRPRKQVELFGECHIQWLRADKLYVLDTEPSGYIRLVVDESAGPLELTATGRIELTSGEMTLQGDELTWDVPDDHVVLSGDCRLQASGAWMSTPYIEAWPEAKKWFIPRNISKIDAER